MQMFSMGMTNAFGEYQEYYLLHLFKNEATSNIAWIGTLQFACMNIFGILVGILCERIDTRLVAFIGGLIMAIALIAASFIKVLWGVIARHPIWHWRLVLLHPASITSIAMVHQEARSSYQHRGSRQRTWRRVGDSCDSCNDQQPWS